MARSKLLNNTHNVMKMDHAKDTNKKEYTQVNVKVQNQKVRKVSFKRDLSTHISSINSGISIIDASMMIACS